MRYSVASVYGPTSEPITLNEAKLHLRETSTDQDSEINLLIAAARDVAETWRPDVCVCRTFDMRLDGFPDGGIDLPRKPVHSVTSIAYVDDNGDSQTLATSYYTFDPYAVRPRIELAYQQSWPSTRDQINAVTVRFVAGWLTPFTANASTDVLTLSGRTIADDTVVRLSNSGGNTRALPAGLSERSDYYVVSSSGSTVKLSTTSGGGAVDVTDTGTGTHFVGELPANIRHAMLLLIGHWNENRETTTDLNLRDVPMAAASLLNSDRTWTP